MDLFKQVYSRSTEIMRELQHLSCQEKLRQLARFDLGDRRLGGDHTVAFQYVKGDHKRDGETLFTRTCSDKKKEAVVLNQE